MYPGLYAAETPDKPAAIVAETGAVLTVDETGRIVLPAKLRQKIGIEGEAYFIAMGDTFQIWKPETYEGHDGEVEDILDDLGGADIWTLLESEEEV